MKFSLSLSGYFLFLNVKIDAAVDPRHVEQVSEPLVFTPNFDRINNEKANTELAMIGKPESRIVGGNDAASGEFPFMVSWYWNFRGPPGCGGSLVAPNLVLTAAHCSKITGQIRIGSRYSLVREEYDAQETVEYRTVKHKIIHPRYNIPVKLLNDFLLLELDSSVDTSVFPPINLNFDENQPSNGKTLTVTGYGLTSEGGKSSATLKKVDVPAISRKKCRQIYGSLVQDDLSLCAGTDEGGKDGCAGDSGGPIFHKVNGVFSQVGVVSWGIGCAQARYPGVYSRVSGAEDWLKKEICSRSNNPKPSYCSSNLPVPPPAPTKPPTIQPIQVPTKLPTHSPTNGPTYSPSKTIPGTPSPTRPLTPIPTLMPTIEPTTPGQCKSCSDNEISWMVIQEEKCTDSPDTLARLCSKNKHWTLNRYCELSCYLAGFGYPGDECCITDEIFASPTPSPVSGGLESLDITYEYNSSCDPSCSDKENDWMASVGNLCLSSYLLETKCNKNGSWIKEKVCQLSCYRAGYGYDGDVCCTEDHLVAITSNPTTFPSPSPSASSSASPSASPSQFSSTSPSGFSSTPSPSASPSQFPSEFSSGLPSVLPSSHPSAFPSPKTTLPTFPPSFSPTSFVETAILPQTTLSPITAAPTTVSALVESPAASSPDISISPEMAEIVANLNDDVIANAGCFSGDNLVKVKTNDIYALTPMEDLQIGDYVQVSAHNYEPIYSFAHRDTRSTIEYLEVNNKIKLSENHLLAVKDRGFIPASMLDIGNVIFYHENENSNETSREEEEMVHTIVRRSAKGVYAPLAASGEIVVSGYLASCFVSLQIIENRNDKSSSHHHAADIVHVKGIPTGFSFHFLSRIFELPHRLACHYLSECKEEEYNDKGINSIWMIQPKAWFDFCTDQANTSIASFVLMPMMVFLLSLLGVGYAVEQYALLLESRRNFCIMLMLLVVQLLAITFVSNYGQRRRFVVKMKEI